MCHGGLTGKSDANLYEQRKLGRACQELIKYIRHSENGTIANTPVLKFFYIVAKSASRSTNLNSRTLTQGLYNTEHVVCDGCSPNIWGYIGYLILEEIIAKILEGNDPWQGPD